MFGIGLPELVIILIVALLVFGPKKLPDLAKSLGKGLAEFRKASDELKTSIESDLKVDLNDDVYKTEVSSSAEPPVSSDGPPPQLGESPAEQGLGTDPLIDDLERGKIETVTDAQSARPEEPSAQTTPPQKEEDQAGASKDSIHRIG